MAVASTTTSSSSNLPRPAAVSSSRVRQSLLNTICDSNISNERDVSKGLVPDTAGLLAKGSLNIPHGGSGGNVNIGDEENVLQHNNNLHDGSSSSLEEERVSVVASRRRADNDISLLL
jgi:hypothetical protein